jgi:hypothetical protein
VGAFLNVGFNDIASFQPEFLYVMEGAKGTGSEEGLKINVNAVEFPLLVRAELTRHERVHPFVVVGPGLLVRTSAKIKFQGQEEDLGNDLKRAGASLIFGGGIAAGPATVEARYNLGLTDWSKDTDTAKTRSVSILVGYHFGK